MCINTASAQQVFTTVVLWLLLLACCFSDLGYPIDPEGMHAVTDPHCRHLQR
jgi:hypothetical protein